MGKGISPNAEVPLPWHGLATQEADNLAEILPALFGKGGTRVSLKKPGSFNALTLAAVKGNIESLSVLISNHTDVNYRISGYTAAGSLLMAIATDNFNRNNRISALQLLLEMGSDIHAPLFEEGVRGSDQTLFDTIQLFQDPQISAISKRLDSEPALVLSIPRVIYAAEQGQESLRAYLKTQPLLVASEGVVLRPLRS